MKHKREKDIEKAFKRTVERNGDLCLKFEVQRGYPDRMVLLKYGGYFLIELKKEGEPLSPYQVHIHNELNNLGTFVFWADTLEGALEIYREQKAKWLKVKYP